MSATADLAVHPVADLMPAMTEDEYTRLRDDIAANGLLDPITLYDDQVLDGRHRLRACGEVGVEPHFTKYDGDSPAQFVLSVNAVRRQLTKSQLAMLALRFLPELTREARERQAHGLTAPGHPIKRSVSEDTERSDNGRERDHGPGYRAIGAAGRAVGIGGITVARAKRVVEQAPDLADEVIAGRMTVGAAHTEVVRRETSNTAAPVPRSDRPLTNRQREVALANKRRLDKSMHTLVGMCEGLEKHLPVEKVLPAAEPDDFKFWVDTLKRSAVTLRAYARRLEESAR